MSILEKVTNIPADLRQNGLFCTWAYQDRPGGTKPAKVPYSPTTGEKARVDHPEDFAPFNAALTAFQTDTYNGIGVLVDKNLCAIDIDNCIDEVGQLSSIAEDIVNQMQTYTEISPSGKGLRLLLTITEPVDQAVYYINNQTYHIEIYTSGTNKYVSLTGNVLIPVQRLEGRSFQLKIVLEKYMRRAKPVSKPIPALPNFHSAILPERPCGQMEQAARAIITKAANAKNGPTFSALMRGDTSAHRGDKSAADLALCNILAFWAKRDPALIDYIFRKSGLYRGKWDRSTGTTTYGRLTIQRAIDGTQKVYSGQLIATYDTFYIGDEWTDMPPDDKGISTEEIIKNLRDYNIAFFPVAPGYYSAHKISGVYYDVRSSFTETGKTLGRILEDVIVNRSAKGHHQTETRSSDV